MKAKNNMQPETPLKNKKSRIEIIGRKRAYGTVYGAIAGLAFALSLWGWDAILLNQHHAFHPWSKLIVGVLICVMAGTVTGWLSARVEKGVYTALFWLGLSIVFSLLTVALPLRIAPSVSTWLEPQLGGLLNYGMDDNFMTRFQVAFIWNAVFSLIAGILQAPLVEPASFSTSIFGKSAPFLACAIILSLGGFTADNLNNEPLRNAVISMDETISFAMEHQGEEIDPAVSREKHLASLRTIEESLSESRKLIVGSYDEFFGQINVLVKFENGWAECTTLYGQASFCKPISPTGH